MPTLAAPLDCAKLETRNERIHQLASAPSSPVTGQQYYNTGDNTFYWWDNSTWVSARGGASATPPATNSALGTIQLAGDLGGNNTATAPAISAGAVTDTKVAAANKDGTAVTPSMRTLGTGALQACAGNDSRLSDSRAPSGSAGGDLTGSTYPNPVVAALAITDSKVAAANKDGAAGTFCMRTLGSAAGTAAPGNRTLDAEPLAVASVNLNSQKIIGLAPPTSGTDAANKAYVDAAAQALDVKPSCRAASVTLTNINLAAPGATIDGVTMASGDRVLVKEQTTNTQNGIYIWNGAATPMTRSTDADVDPDITAGMFTFVTEGTTNADSGWVLTTNDPITIGSTGLVFTQFSGAGQINAGSGLTKTGNTLDVIGTSNRIIANADSIDIDAAYVGQASIRTLASDATGVTTGKWKASIIDIPYGGTNAAAATAARFNLGIPTWYSTATHSAGTSITIAQTTHKILNSKAIIMQANVEATGAIVLPDFTINSSGDVIATFSVSQSANTIRISLIGLQTGAAPDQPV